MSVDLELNVLFIEDDPTDYEQYQTIIRDYFSDKGVVLNLDCLPSFDLVMPTIKSSHVRFDLVISDTYKGDHENHEAAALKMVEEYRRSNKFCSIILISSGICPEKLVISPFVQWVEKIKEEDLISALDQIIHLGTPQFAQNLHEIIDNTAGQYLWGFLEENWEELNADSEISPELLERIIRSRAALIIQGLIPESATGSDVSTKYGLEYYIYPCIEQNHFSFGDIIQNKTNRNDIRVILTPHCHLVIDSGRPEPKADYVLTVKTTPSKEIIGSDLIEKTRVKDETAKHKYLSGWSRSPAKIGKPDGRYWYLPKFLEIPHLYCDFLKLESIEHGSLKAGFDRIATLTPPFSEALQGCFTSFYGSVGIPGVSPNSIEDLLNE